MNRACLFAAALLLAAAPKVFAQAAGEPLRVWTGNFGAGLALTNGNTDTRSINLSMGIVRDPKKRSVVRLNGLYLRGNKDSLLIVNQTQFTGRGEINVSMKTFVFGQLSYAKDTFKGIRYLYSPTAGVGYKFVNTDAVLFGIDTGLGGVWEHDDGQPRSVTGAYNVGERFAWKVSKTAAITQSISSLWKTNDWADSLHNFTLGLAASVTPHSEVKVELLDSFKNKPSLSTLQKNDASLITALVFKF